MTQVQPVIVRVHVHDPGCSIPDCALKAVLDQAAAIGAQRIASAVLAATMPPSGIPLGEAIAMGMAEAKEQLGWTDVSLLSVAAGPFAVVAKTPNGDLRWVWAIEVATADGLQYFIACIDYTDGSPVSTQSGSVQQLAPSH